ncbi:MAG: ABC transporter substrate-binding protein [Phycisphaerae bacterium]|nr:ABC transporter substrate-binding protein [Phycisphaerae bacterium]
MLWLKRFIFVFPVLLGLFFAAAFTFVKQQVAPHENVLTMGSIGEPENVNPIRATTTSASDVTNLVFNGLIKFDENMNMVGDLATSWDLSQNSRLFFNTEDDAKAVLAAAEALMRGRAAAPPTTAPATQPARLMVPHKASRDAKVVTFDFEGSAGTEYQDALADVLAKHPPRKVYLLAISPRPSAKFSDGVELKPAAVEERARTAIAKADAVIVEHYVVLDSMVQWVFHGERDAVEKALTALFLPDDPDNGLADLSFEEFPGQDRPSYVFHLRRGVMWQGGQVGGKVYEPKEFTAEDVKFTWDMLVSSEIASPRASDYVTVESATALDPYAIRITYKKPYSLAVNSWSMGILPRHILDGKGPEWWADNYDRHPIGTGPFKFDQWKSGEWIRMVRNQAYYEGPPNLDAIYIRYIPDQLNIQLTLETGGIDFYSIEPQAVGRAIKDKRLDLVQFQSRSYNYIGWNMKRPLFQDVRVRRALAQAINIDDIIQYILYGYGVQSTGIYAPQFYFCNPHMKDRLLKYDPEKAKALLAEAGWKAHDAEGYLVKDGQRFEFDLITNNANEIRKDICVVVQSDLKKVGVKVNLKQYEWSVFIQRYIDAQNFDACVLGWQMSNDFDMYQLFHSSQTHPGELNFCSYKNKEADLLIDRLRTTYSEDGIKRLAWRLQEIVYEDQPYVFLDVPEATVGIQRNTFRVYRPHGNGKWVDEPIRETKAGFDLYLPYWYRVKYPPAGLAEGRK